MTQWSVKDRWMSCQGRISFRISYECVGGGDMGGGGEGVGVGVRNG